MWKIPVPHDIPADVAFAIRDQLPSASDVPRPQWQPTTALFTLGSLYDLVAGHYHSLSDLPPGNVPVVSCGDQNNGISGYYDVQQHLNRNKLTIAFNGMNTLTTKYHPYTFAAKDDVAICSPKRPLRLTTQLFVQMMLNRERWRFSYYRKCFIDKLRRYQVYLPTKDGQIDEDAIQGLVETSPYWSFLKTRFTVQTQ
jgi:type I restriction enzyme M protein